MQTSERAEYEQILMDMDDPSDESTNLDAAVYGKLKTMSREDKIAWISESFSEAPDTKTDQMMDSIFESLSVTAPENDADVGSNMRELLGNYLRNSIQEDYTALMLRQGNIDYDSREMGMS